MHFPLAKICAFSMLPLVPTFSPSIVISCAVAPGLFPNSTPPVVGLKLLDLFFKMLFILRVAGFPLTKDHEATEECMVRYMVVLRVLVVFLQHGINAFQ